VPSQVPDRTSNRCEVLIGRTLAACMHPLAAWRSSVASFRMLAVAGYIVAGYIAVLLAMVLLN